MTRRLVLVRHAKSATDDGPDAARPLASRGVKDAPAIGRQLLDWGISPARVVVSPARRAAQTWELAAAQLDRSPDPVLDERVYGNTVDDLFAVVRSTPADVDTLVLVGHNPSIEEFGSALDDRKGDPAARRASAHGYPTSALAVFGIDVSWDEVRDGSGSLSAFATPRS